MRLYGLMVVQNEGDIILDVLTFLRNLKLYSKIFLFDLGSTDDTFEKAQDFKDLLSDPQVLNKPYTEKLRWDLLDDHKSFFKEGDWVAIVDADEFYVDQPLDFIEAAEKEGANCIETYQAQFQLTDLDVKNLIQEDQSLPIYERRKFYLINWSEERFFKVLSPEDGLFSSSRRFSKRLLNRHYQFRTPSQIQLRIKTRRENQRQARHLPGRQEWRQIFSDHWTDYVVPNHILHEYSGSFRFGLPPYARWKDYYSKDPFAPILPQIAEAFRREQEKTPVNRERIFIRDSYLSYVISDLSRDLANQEWREAIDGLFTYFLVVLRKMKNAVLTNLHFVIGKMNLIVSNSAMSVRRMFSGRSVGFVWASPNPIEISDYSGAGATLIKWKAFRAKTVELRLNTPDGLLLFNGGRQGQQRIDNGITDGTICYLKDPSEERGNGAAAILSKVIIKIRYGKTITI